MIFTVIVLGFVIILFVFEWVMVDVVCILMMVLLPLLGLVNGREAFSGLSSNAVCSIIAVIIIGAGLDKTGVMNQVASPIIKLAGRSEKRIIALIGGTVGVISSMMQNIGAAALFLPAAQRISKRIDIPSSRILMPMGFCAIIGGTLTLVGASPTIRTQSDRSFEREQDLLQWFDPAAPGNGGYPPTPGTLGTVSSLEKPSAAQNPDLQYPLGRRNPAS